jgi:hypothetical protein
MIQIKQKAITLLFLPETTDVAISHALQAIVPLVDKHSSLKTYIAYNGVMTEDVPGLGNLSRRGYQLYRQRVEAINAASAHWGWIVGLAQKIQACGMDFTNDAQAERYVMIQAAGADALALEAVRLCYFPRRMDRVEEVLKDFPVYLKQLRTKLHETE